MNNADDFDIVVKPPFKSKKLRLSSVEEGYRLITLVGGCMDTRTNKEDFALTPYLSGVWVKISKIAGIGITWGWWSAYIGIAFMLPKKVKRFRVFK